MAAFSLSSVIAACSRCGHIAASIANLHARSISRMIQVPSCARMLSTSQHQVTEPQSSQKSSQDQSEYPADFEVSYEEFKYVEQILPRSTVPDIPHHKSYPTPSGWYPPNDALRSQHKFLVLRTKNHMLPVYSSSRSSWMGLSHKVTVKRVEGDIWALESELRNFLQKKTGLKEIKTQVHEVSRKVRISGMHGPLVAEFLLACGM